MRRRKFINNGLLAIVGMSLADRAAAALRQPDHSLPRWKGFNVLDFFSPGAAPATRPTTEDHFSWMRDWGVDFIRVPIAYPYYVRFDRNRNIKPEEVYEIDAQKVEEIEKLVAMAHRYGMHVSLNLHRAPGYCINAGFHEPYNLWKDAAAQDAFSYHWAMWAKKYKEYSSKKISFDLLNEPSMREDMNDQLSERKALPGDLYYKVVRAATEAIRKENSGHLVIADGNNVGNDVVPELVGLNIGQSCRGYHPHAISHYKAPWANKDPEHSPEPLWPGQVGNQYLSRAMLETYYKPWIALKEKGVGVHCGECGAWNRTPHDVFIAWMSDMLDVLGSHGIGFAVWNFIGDFGVLDSGRTDVAYEDWHGHKLDRRMLDMLRKA